MTGKSQKNVLIVDDDIGWHERLRRRFLECVRDASCPYEFSVDTASSAAEGIDMFRREIREKRQYDVMVFDIYMETPQAGLDGGVGVGMQLHDNLPVIIFFTGYPTYKSCVQAIRNGAWDYITKADVGDRPAAQAVVDSAVDRLRELDLRESHEKLVESWVPEHLNGLQADYGGRIVALWREHESIQVVASGGDAFDLAKALNDFREGRPSWQQPYLLRVPPLDDDRDFKG